MSRSLNFNSPHNRAPRSDNAADPAWRGPDPGSSARDEAVPPEPISADTGNGIGAALLLVAMLVAGIAVRVLRFCSLP